MTPASARDIYDVTQPNNTWGGPIVEQAGTFHAFIPIYAEGALFGARQVMHGTAASPTGPFTWGRYPDLPGAINPAFVVYPHPSTGRPVYSLWVGGKIQVADSAAGPYRLLEGVSYPGVNPAPMYHDGAFYMTNQHTTNIYRAPSLDPEVEWVVVANISHAKVPAHVTPEDPYLWVDKRGNWHIINHACAHA